MIMGRRFYGTRAWRRLSAECLARDPVCTAPGCREKSLIADHIVPRAQGGADTLANTRGLCASCHGGRRGTAEPRARGAHADGTPRDAGHWWRT
jgi:5-methylcytosine-specific restriction protein A